MSDVRIFVNMSIPDGKQEAARTALGQLVAKVRETDDRSQTLEYDACFSPDGSSAIMLERYRDAAALGAHMQAIGDQLGAVMATVQIESLHVIGQLPDEMKAAFAQMAPRYAEVAFSLSDPS